MRARNVPSSIGEAVLALDATGVSASLSEGSQEAAASTMLTPGIHKSYCEGVEALAGHNRVENIARGKAGSDYHGQQQKTPHAAKTLPALSGSAFAKPSTMHDSFAPDATSCADNGSAVCV